MSRVVPSISAPVTVPNLFGSGVTVVSTGSGEKPRVRVKAGSSSRLAPTVSNFMTKNAPVVSPYDAASPADIRDRPQNIGPNDVARYQRVIVTQARQLFRNRADVRRGLRSLASDVVGAGPRPKPRLKAMIPILKRWFKQCDVTGQRAFGAWLRHVYLSRKVDGEAFVRLRPRFDDEGYVLPLQLQALEPDHCPWEWTRIAPNGNRVVAGVELDKLGRPVAYWMTPYHPADGLVRNLDPTTNLPEPVAATVILHVTSPDRLSGLRGESSLQSAIVPAQNLATWDLATETRQNTSAMFAGYVRRLPEDGGAPLPNEEQNPELTSQLIQQIPLEPGIIAELPYGTTIDWNDPPDTGPNYEPYQRRKLLYLASAVDSTYEDFTGDWRGASDRTWRAGQVQRRVLIDCEREDLTFQVWDPLYRVLVDLAVGLGLVVPPAGMTEEEIYDCPLTWPGNRNPNQYQEYNAYTSAVTAGLMARDDACEQLGGDAEEIDESNGISKKRAETWELAYSVFPPTAAPSDLSSAIAALVDKQVQRILDQRAAEQDVNPDEETEPTPGKRAAAKKSPPGTKTVQPRPRPAPAKSP